MPGKTQWMDWLQRADFAWSCSKLYGRGDETMQRRRYEQLIASFAERFGEDRDIRIFSAPGRTEIGGNHTDHNHGCVLAAAVTVDTVAAVSPREDTVVTLYSEGYPHAFKVNLADMMPRDEEKATTQALIRGVAARMQALGYQARGFDACVSSTVLGGSGLSSSAAFEVLIVCIFDCLYNEGTMSPTLRAQVGQYAENVYFGKPSGLMDQMASSLGELITIDFAEPANPQVQQVHFDFEEKGIALVVVNTGGSHADLGGEYAAIATDMREVASAFSCRYLREINPGAFYEALPRLSRTVSERALLRAMHFYQDNERVAHQVEALQQGDWEKFRRLVIASGLSSWKYLQNCYVSASSHQPLALALAVSEMLLGDAGASRVHGGGFAGTMQAFVPQALVGTYVATMNAVFGEGAATALSIRAVGATEVKGRVDNL